jgi:cytochrome c biogenesis protein CcmG/thiol:disulfide interchange protein DsbE
MSTFKDLLRPLWLAALLSLLAVALLFSPAVAGEERSPARDQDQTQTQDQTPARSQAPDQSPVPEPNQAELPLAPSFSLKNLDGQRVALDDLLGRGPLLIDFWATWCKPCVKELPHLHDLYLKYRDRGFQVVAISEDSPRSLSKVKSFVAGNRYEFLVLLDENSTVQRKFNFRALPYTVLLDRDGHVIHSRMGYRPGDERVLEEELLVLLEAQEAAEEASEQSAGAEEDSVQASEQTTNAGEENQDGGGESGTAATSEAERDEQGYVKKVKSDEARKVQAEEKNE